MLGQKNLSLVVFKAEEVASTADNALNLGNVVNGSGMFYGCRNLYFDGSTTFDLSSLESGDYMFVGPTVFGIGIQWLIDSLPTYTDGSTHNLHITGQVATASGLDAGLFGVGTYIPSYDEAVNNNEWATVTGTSRAGWNIYFASSSSGWTVRDYVGDN